LSPGIRRRLSQPFVSMKRSEMGIGLAIWRAIVEGHGGGLVAETGFCRMIFRVLLPIARLPGVRS
jgi:nitrogen-specific signal transduction histidine kinase